MADNEKNNEAGMPAADVNFLITCLQHANGGSITVSLLFPSPCRLSPSN